MLEQWFEGKTVAITGAGDGIGRASALLFASRGARVVATDINEAAAAATAKLISDAGGQAKSIRVDVSNDTEVAAMVAFAQNQFGQLNCAFNNAGICPQDDYLWGNESSQRTFDVNISGTMNCIRHEIPALLEAGGGTIVNTASLAGFISNRANFQPAYSASKHAVIGLTKTAALQYARQNIRVNSLCPGTTRTAMVESVMNVSEDVRQMLENHSPMGRMASPEEMAEAAIWLCSSKSSFVNGHALIVDGGSYVE